MFDTEHSEFEERWFTATGPDTARARIISAREATRNERQQYENEPR